MNDQEAASKGPSTTPPSFHYAITSVRFSDSSEITIGRGEVLVIVGGNNVGKSRALKDIVSQLEADDAGRPSCPVVKRIVANVSVDELEVQEFLESLEIRQKNADEIGRMGVSIHRSNILGWLKDKPNASRYMRQNLLPLNVYRVDTINRLAITDQVESIDLLREPKKHPYHYLADSAGLEGKISATFREAFGTDLIVNRTAGSKIHMHVGERPFPLGVYNLDEASRIALSNLPLLRDQGDGMRAFVGCLMWGTVVDYKVVLIDEPEAFLHPPQARIIGRTLIKEKRADTQLIISTHSDHLLRGILDAGAKNVRVIRLTRKGGTNSIKEVKPERLTELVNDSLVRQTNLLDALFHEVTFVCEGDADCQFYSSIARALADRDKGARNLPDALYLHSGGKDRMPALVTPLRTMGVPVRVVADFDVLRNEHPLRAIVEALGGSWDEYASDWKIVSNDVSSQKAQLDRSDLADALDVAMKKVVGQTVSDDVLTEIKEAARKASAWGYAKSIGEAFLRPGDATAKYQTLKKRLAKLGLFIVPVGQIESFCKSIGGHGPGWVEKACAFDLIDDPLFESARRFVDEITWPR